MSKGIPENASKFSMVSYWKAPSPSHIHVAVVCCFEEGREISIVEASVTREDILGLNCLENPYANSKMVSGSDFLLPVLPWTALLLWLVANLSLQLSCFCSCLGAGHRNGLGIWGWENPMIIFFKVFWDSHVNLTKFKEWVKGSSSAKYQSTALPSSRADPA